MLTIDGVRYKLWTPQDEENEFHPLVKKNYRQIFGDNSLYFDLKQKLSSKSGLVGIPDAYVIKLDKPETWYIVENELSSHNVYEHIVGQVTKFMSLIDEFENQRELVRVLCREIENDEELYAYVKKRVGPEIFRFLSELLSTQPRIALIIDSTTPKLEKVQNTLRKIANTDIVEFRTYRREDAENVRAHVFEPLYAEGIILPGATAISGGLRAREEGKRDAERHIRRLEFWTKLLERSKNKTDLFSRRKPSRDHWLATGAGRSGIIYCYVILRHSAGIELYIDTGDQNTNKNIFDELVSKKAEIESNIGSQLEWQRLNNKRACRIWKKTSEDKGLRNPEAWAAIQGEMIDVMIRFEKAFREPISRLK